MTLYNIKTADGTYRITKFDDDLNPLETYDVSSQACTCPAGVRPMCRHRHMLDVFIAADAIDQLAFYDYDRGAWQDEEPLPPPPSLEDQLRASLPEGVDMIVLDSPDKVADVHNAIADAVGEPRLSRRKGIFS